MFDSILKGFLWWVAAISIVSFYGCKPGGENSITEVPPSVETYVYYNQEGISPSEIASWRASAQSILEKRQADFARKTYEALVKDLWLVDAYLSSDKMVSGDSVRGAWLDFKDDLTYEYGFGDKKTGMGTYFYEFESSKLLMLDNNALLKPQEFNVRLRNDMVILVGEYVYRDNNLQSKLTRGKSYPANRLETKVSE
jgi:hypothetical protein